MIDSAYFSDMSGKPDPQDHTDEIACKLKFTDNLSYNMIDVCRVFFFMRQMLDNLPLNKASPPFPHPFITLFTKEVIIEMMGILMRQI